MKILLLENVSKLGKAGEIVNVADGYAKNFLIPQKKGQEATKAVLKSFEEKQKVEQARRVKAEAEAAALAKELSGKIINVKAKAGDNGKLFGAVTAQDVADALKEQLDLDVDKKKVIVPEDIKTVGDYTVTVKLLANASADIHMSVTADA